MAKLIPLSQGYSAVVDDDDYERLAGFCWHAHVQQRVVYAARKVKGRRSFMHREIMEPSPGMEVDHIRHQETMLLDNRRENLRVVSLPENRRNRRKPRGGSSIFKGVTACGGGGVSGDVTGCVSGTDATS